MAQSSDSSIVGSVEGQNIVLENVRKTFANGTVVAAEDINLKIQPDEFVVLLGPSGCGKTTTLRCISGLETPDEGSISIGSNNVTNDKPKDRDLAFVFQTIALFPHMSVRDNMKFGLDMKTNLNDEEKEERIRDAAKTLGIAEMLDRRPNALSGGQQQRVSIGRAMVTEPAAFLLDEPFSALDANLRDQMQTEVKTLHRQLERAMIFVTHDQEEAMTLGDKIVVMDDGAIQQVGSPHEIYNDPESRFVAGFIGSPSTNMIDCTVIEQDGTVILESDLFTIQMPENAHASLTSHIGQQVTIGIRPEYLELDDGKLFGAEINIIEPKGSRDVVHLDSDDYSLTATIPQGKADNKQAVNVSFDLADAWFFDESGNRIR